MSKGILVLNLGTPKDLSKKSIRTYLKTFLMDPFVLRVPYLIRAFIVHILILPFRTPKTQKAYQSIWTKEGSPLLIHTENLSRALQKELQLPTQTAMRYGDPSIQKALESFQKQGIFDLSVVLLYPQYALSTTETAQSELQSINQIFFGGKFQFNFIKNYYADPDYIQSVTHLIRPKISPHNHLALSFHGLPWSHLGDSVEASSCNSPGCCERISEKNKNCYRAQSYETARLIAQDLGLPPDRWSIGFQSRLAWGWITPFTDKLFVQLANNGIKNLVVACPSFSSDCLETLEEIQIRGKESFLEHGGEVLDYAPCVNDSPLFVQFLKKKILQI